MTRRNPTPSRRPSRLSLAGLLACALCLGLAAPAAAADLPKAEELFARHAAAIGGDAIEGIKNMAAEFTFDMPAMGISTNGESYLERPGKSYSKMSMATMGGSDFESGVNDGIAWDSNPQTGLRILDGNERRMAIRGTWLNPFARWQDLWESAETTGEATVDEAACYTVVLTPEEGEPVTSYFDKETGLLVQEKLNVPQMGATITTRFRDYREVDGVKLAHRYELGGMMAFTIQYTSVRYNVDDIPADAFELPQRIKEMAAEVSTSGVR